MNESLLEETYAVVVGIEQYEMGSSLNRDGVAIYALNFTNWLLNCQVPQNNIYLFISEEEKDGKRDLISEYQQEIERQNGNKTLNDNLKQIAINKATRDNIYRTIFTELRTKKSGKLLVFYWIGHGYMTQGETRQLLYSDSGYDNILAPQATFNFDLFLKSLKTDIFTGFQQQIFFIDACANFAKYQYRNENCYLIEGSKPKKCEQLIFYSSQRGYKATIHKKIAYFSDVLLTLLSANIKKLAYFNLDAFNYLSTQIQQTFQEKYPEEKYPISLWHGMPDGSEVPILSDSIEKEFKIFDSIWDDFTQVISQLKDNLIEVLVKQFLFKYYSDPNSICSDLYKDSCELKENNFLILKNIILMISQEKKRKVQLPVILEFCQFISQSNLDEIEPIKSKLNQFIETTAQNLNISSDIVISPSIEPLYSQGLPYLIILFEKDLESSSKNQSKNKLDLNLKPELRFQEQVNSKTNIVCKYTNNQSIPVNESNIYQELYKLIKDTYRQLAHFKNTNGLTIELFLPKEYLINPNFIPEVEKLPDNEDPNPGWFGSRYKLVFRSSDRFGISNPERYVQLLRKWNILEELSCQDGLCPNTIKEKIYCIKQPNQQTWIKLPQKISTFMISLSLNCPLLDKSYQSHIDSFFINIWRCGIPFGFWLRGNSLNNLKLREEERINNTEFEDLLTVENIKDYDKLCENIKSIRENAYVETIENRHQEYLGYHLGFLFDNPYRLHSNFDINSGGDTLAFAI